MMSTNQKTDVNVVAIENNSYSNVALDDEGRVWTWGSNYNSYRLGRVTEVATNRVNPFNRGGQVTDTIYPGEKLPYILQISGAEEVTMVLDQFGNVWSWGDSADGGLGRTGSNNRPGKVKFPDGVKIKWVTAAYNGGKAIDMDGNIWVWGNGRQYGLGTGTTADVSTPVMLTLDAAGNPLPNKFIKISSSDYFDRQAAIALTSDGDVYTWGNNNDPEKAGAMRPMKTGFNKDIKKIDCGNGTFGFLTNSGELWTWGDNNLVAGRGRQGHGDRLDRTAPQKVVNVTNGGTTPAPLFKDFSIYAWSVCAVDFEGNIYGSGENNNTKHANAVATVTLLTKYLPRNIPEDTKIFVVAEGYFSTSYVDIYGNAYVTGDSDARGNNANDGSLPGPWVHFNGSGRPMFTSLDSSPTSEAKRYSNLPLTTLNATTNIPCDEVKYVIINPEDTDTFKDGKTFYSKSFAELELPYYLKGTDPKLLLSPNSDLWSSRYYANPKITEEVFDAIYNIKTGSEKGLMDVVPGSDNKSFTKPELVSFNCIVWVQTKNKNGTTRALYRFDNYYTQTKAWMEGVKKDDPTFNLYQPELIGGGYGLFLDRQGKLIPGKPPFGYDLVKPAPKALTYWKLAPDSQTAEKLADDGYVHRLDRSKEVFLTEESQKGDDSSKTPRVTFTYEKDPAMWVDADLYFVNEGGDFIQVVIGPDKVNHQERTQFAPKGAEYVEGQEPYLPPEAVLPTNKVVGYSVGTKPDGSPGSYKQCSFPDGFKPKLDAKTDIYIVYSSGMVSVTETYTELSKLGNTEIKNSEGLASVVKNLRKDMDNYDGMGPKINDMVIVGHIITPEGGQPTQDNYDWEDGAYKQKGIRIDGISENTTVNFLYKADKNNNGIPDEEEGTVVAQWIAVNANNVSYRITDKTYYGNGFKNAQVVIQEAKATVLPTAMYNPNQWLFRPGQDGDVAPYAPKGGGSTETVTFEVGKDKQVFFYYDEDYNTNGIADKTEGFFVEKYKKTDKSDLVPPKPDVNSKWLGGQKYTSAAPLVQDYVAVGYLIEADGVRQDGNDRVDRDKTGNVSVSYDIPPTGTKKDYTVTFLYMEDKNNNNIPDQEEGKATIKWVGTTYAGNTVEIMEREIVGYAGDNVTDMIFPPDNIPDVWKFVSDDVPDTVTLTHDPKTYTYKYSEILEFATITVEAKSTDEKLNFYYQYSKRITDAPFKVTAFAIPTYKVTGYELYDGFGTKTGSGMGDTVTIDPSIGSQKVVFIYESTVTTVVIRAVASDDFTNILSSQTITDAVIGQKYAAKAPYVDDTWVLADDLLKVIDVKAGTNIVIFDYDKATGNVTLLLKENDKDGPIIRVLSPTLAQGGPVQVDIPDLSESFYTTISDTKQTVDFTGAQPVPGTVEYYYKKDMMDATVTAADADGGAELDTRSYKGVARKGESYTATALPVKWYTVAEPGTKSVYVDPAAPKNTITVPFIYKKDNIGDITVRSFYKDAGGNDVELNTYTAKSVVDSKYTAEAGAYPGFALKDGQAGATEIIVSEDADKNHIDFEYDDKRMKVGVFTQIKDDLTSRKPIKEEKVVSGDALTLIPPYMKDHLVSGYIVGTGALKEVDPDKFESVTLTKDEIKDGLSVVFVYEPVQEIVDERYITVTVVGATGALTHYSYEMRVARDDLPKTLTAPGDVFDVPGYALADGADLVITAPKTGDTVEKRFEYRSLATVVTIKMVDGVGTKVAESFTVGATAGAPFSYYAPHVPNYFATGDLLGTVNPVPADGSGVITFTYKSISSKVTIIAKEDDASGRVIGMFDVSDPFEGTKAYNAPDLTKDFYTAKSPTVSITYDGVNSVSAEVYYTKDKADVPIEAHHYMTGADLGAQAPLAGQRKGEVVTVNAPNIANYIVVGSASQLVIADGAGKAVFKYRPLGSDEVAIKAVDTKGNTLQSYALTGAKDETVSAKPPVILGWKTSDAPKSAVIGTDKEIVFTYDKDVVTVTVNAVDTSGKALSTAQTEAPRGGNYTAYAPHIPGYVLQGSGVSALTNLAADQAVTFTYKPVEEVVVTVTLIGRSAKGELYRDIVIRPVNSGRYEAEAKTVAGYHLTSASPAILDIKESDETVTFDYESNMTTVTIRMIDEDTGRYLIIYVNKAATGSSYTYNAPDINGYKFTGTSMVGNVNPVKPNGASVINFYYKKA